MATQMPAAVSARDPYKTLVRIIAGGIGEGRFDLLADLPMKRLGIGELPDIRREVMDGPRHRVAVLREQPQVALDEDEGLVLDDDRALGVGEDVMVAGSPRRVDITVQVQRPGQVEVNGFRQADVLLGGFALGHASGDGNAWTHWLLWAHGGKLVDKNDKVALDSAETRAALEYCKQLYATFAPGTISWNDSFNNKAFLSGRISLTNNGISIYAAAQRNAAKGDAKAAEVAYKEKIRDLEELVKDPATTFDKINCIKRELEATRSFFANMPWKTDE